MSASPPGINLSNAKEKVHSPQISGAAVYAPTATDKMIVKDLDGKTHEVERQNANDLVKHNGWILLGPVPKKEAEPIVEDKKEAPEGSAALVEGESGSGVTVTPEEKEALDSLDALRTKVKKEGFKVNKDWGIKTLNAKLAEAATKASKDSTKK